MTLRKIFTMKNPRVKYNVNFLKDKATKDQFNITLSNKFQILDEHGNIEDQWSQIKDMINNTCEETHGRKSYTQKEWIRPETLRKVQERKQKKCATNCSRTRKEKATAQAEYNKAHKEVKQSVRKDRRTYIENLAAQAEEAANMRNMKDLYDTTKNTCRKFQTNKPTD